MADEITNDQREDNALDALEKAEEQIKSDTPAGDVADTSEQVAQPEGDDISPDVSDDTGTPEDLGENEVLESLDSEVLQCLRDYYPDDQEILHQLEINPDLGDQIREVLDEELDERRPEKPEEKTEPIEKVQQQFEELQFNLDPDIVGADVKGAIDKMASMLNQYGKQFSDSQQRMQSDREVAFGSRVDSAFDKYTKNVPGLGNSFKLSNSQKRLRSKLLDYASVEAKHNPRLSLEQAIDLSVKFYRNQGGKKAATQELINKLNRQDKRTIGRPTRRISQQKGQRKYADEYEEAEDKMAQAEVDAGLSA